MDSGSAPSEQLIMRQPQRSAVYSALSRQAFRNAVLLSWISFLLSSPL